MPELTVFLKIKVPTTAVLEEFNIIHSEKAVQQALACFVKNSFECNTGIKNTHVEPLDSILEESIKEQVSYYINDNHNKQCPPGAELIINLEQLRQIANNIIHNDKYLHLWEVLYQAIETEAETVKIA